MATINLGKVCIVPKGDYDSTVTYAKLDLVRYNGQAYVATSAVSGIAPSSDSDYWKLLVSDGIFYATAGTGIIINENEISVDEKILENKANKAEVDALLENKADKADTYPKTEVDSLLAQKADETDVYPKTEVDNLLASKANLTKTENILAVKDGIYDLENGITIVIADQLITVKGTATVKGFFNLLDMTAYGFAGTLPVSDVLYSESKYYVRTFETDESSARYFVKDDTTYVEYLLNRSTSFTHCSAFGLTFVEGTTYNYSVKFQITEGADYSEYIYPFKIPEIYEKQLLSASRKVNLINIDNFSDNYDNGDMTVSANGSHISITSNSATTSSFGITIPITPIKVDYEKYYTFGVQNALSTAYETNVSNITLKAKTSGDIIVDDNGEAIRISGFTHTPTYPIVTTAKIADNQTIGYIYLWISGGNTINTEFDIQFEEGEEQSVIIDTVALNVNDTVTQAFAESKLESIPHNVPVVNPDSTRAFKPEKKDIFTYPPRVCFGGEYLTHWYEKIYSADENAVIDLEGDSITAGYNPENDSYDDAFVDMRGFAIRRIMKSGGFPDEKLTVTNNGKGSRTTNEWVGNQGNYYYESDKTDYPNGIIDNGDIGTADLIICAYGENDAVMGVNQTNKSVTVSLYERLQIFESNYREALERIRDSETVNGRPCYNRTVENCSVILCVPTCASDRGQRYIQNWHQYVREIIFKLAEEYKCAVCDFSAVTSRWSNPDYADWSTYDSNGRRTAIHPNKYATMYFTSALADLIYPGCLHKTEGSVSTSNLANGAITKVKLSTALQAEINEKANVADVDVKLADKADLIRSKNIFDFDKWATAMQGLTSPIYHGTLDTIDFSNKSITITGTSADCYTNGYNTTTHADMRIPVEANTTYTASWNYEATLTYGTVYIFFNGIATTGNFVWAQGSKGYLTFTTPDDTTYLTIRFGTTKEDTITFSSVMIEEAAEKSLYIPNQVSEGVRELAQSTEIALAEIRAQIQQILNN